MPAIDKIKLIQELLSVPADGDFGTKSRTALYALIEEAQVERRNTNLIDPLKFALSRKGETLILEQEGFDQPGQWVGGASGVTIGVGYDLGTVTRKQFEHDWRGRIPDDDLTRLANTIGFQGEQARRACREVADIKIPHEVAVEVFNQCTVPDFWLETKKAFPGVENLPPDVQGALLSLVYNRGTSMAGDRRSEMRAIRGVIADPSLSLKQKLDGIRANLASMARLWPKDSGVYQHRLAEIAAVGETINSLPA